VKLARATIALLCGLAALAVGCGSSHHARSATTPDDRAAIAAAETPSSPTARVVAPAARAIDHGPRSRRVVALTFDADMTRAMLSALRAGRVAAAYDPRIVALLRSTHTPSTIFLTGLWTERYASVARSLARDPLFQLENHTVDHAAFTGGCYGLPAVTDRGAQRAEIAGAAATIARVTGVRPGYLRFPGGCFDRGAARLANSLGERPVQWDVASGDAFLRDPAAVASNTLRQVKPGSIVVLHLNGAPNAPATADALAQIIPGLRAKGLRPVKLDELVAP
jgi:peptidoglycan/xylan/chitin deacetylase (PgdA/CDA1 family)